MALEAIQALRNPNEPVIFGGDLNEDFWPRRIFEEGGFTDCFSATNAPIIRTHPARPTGDPKEDRHADHTLDWLFSDALLRPVSSYVVPLSRHSGGLSASDHFPVMTTFKYVSL